MRVTRDRTRRDVPYRVPSWTDPVVARATGVVGGPLGRYAVVGARGLAGVAAALALLGAAVLAVGVWQKGHCLLKGWTTPDQFWRACYSDLPVVHVSSPLASRELPWSGAIPSDQAPLPGLVMWLLARVSPSAGQGLGAQQWIFGLWAVVCVLLLAAATLGAVAMLPRRPWHAAHLAVSPVLATLALVSTDLLGVCLTLLGVLAWRRGRGWLAGLLLGLALLVRPFPLVWVAAIVLVARRSRARADGVPEQAVARGELLRAGQVVVGAAVGALAVVVPLQLVEPRSLTGAVDWWGQGAGYGALQMVPRLLGSPLLPATSTVVAVAGWVVALGLGAWLAGRPGWRPGVVRLAAAMTAVVALTAPSLSVQSGLWLLPLLALSSRPWWEHLLWASVETVHFLATWLHIAFATDPGRGLPPETYALVVVLRAGAWAWLLWRVAEEPSVRPPRPPRQEGVPALVSPGAAARPGTADGPT